MSGTSLDGVTGALVRIEERSADDVQVSLLSHYTEPYGEEREQRIRGAIENGRAQDLALLHADLGEWLAECAGNLLDHAGVIPEDVAFIASHGQTIWHLPRRSSFQLGNPAVIAERVGTAVVSDFRSRDVAAGGEGAPLVPRADRMLYSAEDAPRALLNIGGIANVTVVPPRGDQAPLLAFDTGPGVMVIDACVQKLFPDMRYDDGGHIARSGRILDDVADECLAHPYFAEHPPKSTGRELFGSAFADSLIARCFELGGKTADAVATATHVTVTAIGRAAKFIPANLTPRDVVRSGGGARNPVLAAGIESAWKGPVHKRFDDLFFDGDAKEAVAFALLGYLTWTGRPGNEPCATGAAGPRILGSITPA
jgi:anhydro-N-acetylmuramic acid kinase